MINNSFIKVKMKDIAFVNPNSVKMQDDEYVTFLPMSSVSEDGKIIAPLVKRYAEVKSGFTSFQENDILIAKITPSFENYKGCICKGLINSRGFGSTEFHVLRAKDSIKSDFLNIVTRTHKFRQVGERNMTGTAGQKRVPASFIRNYEFLLPPLPEQKAIASLLSVWDDAIEKTERLIEAKEKRFNNLRHKIFSNLTKNKSSIKMRLYEICDIAKGQQLNRTDMKDDGNFYVLNGGIIPSGYTNNWNTMENTISISEGGNSCGFINFNKEKFWAGGHCYTLKNLTDKINIGFLFHYLKCNQEKIMRLRVGSGLPNIQKKDIENIKILIPDLTKQISIAFILNLTQTEIELLKNKNEKYKTQKRGLMQKLLTGKWRVKIKEEL